MNDLDLKRVQKITEAVAAKEGISVSAVRKQMLLAITEAFNTRHEPGHEAFIRTFGDRCPSVEEFILTAATSSEVQEDNASGSHN